MFWYNWVAGDIIALAFTYGVILSILKFMEESAKMELFDLVCFYVLFPLLQIKNTRVYSFLTYVFCFFKIFLGVRMYLGSFVML